MKYTGQLGKPIVLGRLGLLATEDDFRQDSRRIATEMLAKLPLLAETHDVEPGDWFALAMALAKAHVPGFNVVQPPGRKTEWTDVDKAEFWIDVDHVAGPSKKTIDAAITAVRKLDQWAKKTESMKLPALRKHYYDADPRWVQIVKEARAYESMVSKD